MKQVLQSLRTGEVRVEEVAMPGVRSGHLLIRTTRSLISSGTERMMVEFGRAGYLAKARQQPERVREVLEKARTDGVIPVIESVRSKLDQPIPMGYCNVGRVIGVGDGVEGFVPGDRVASNGPHAEIVIAPKHLAAKVPDSVSDDAAVFTVIGSVALQGVRLLDPTLGESVAVFGLGLVGLLAAQILQADGARVIGLDRDPVRVKLARHYGIDAADVSDGTDPVAVATAFSGGHGVDGVLITASTGSSELVHQAAQMSRKRGRIVLTGVVGLELRRSDFYDKELQFQVSCSYGPGRYDPDYEERGHDYPLGFVRWTEERNLATVLDLLAHRRLRVDRLISERVPLDQTPKAYQLIFQPRTIGVLLEYPSEPQAPTAVVSHAAPRPRTASPVVCGVIGSGSFAQARLLPALSKTDVRLKWIASAHGVSGAVAARRFGIELSTTDADRILADPEVTCVVVATRHDSHARFVIQSLEAGKSIFVEKPLCLRAEELDSIRNAHERALASPSPPLLMVGYNRRFAPFVGALRDRLAGLREPLAMVFTCNAGPVPADHWVNDPSVGGGRLVGEACHFVDLLHFLAESPIDTVSASSIGHGRGTTLSDTATINLQFCNGSVGSVHYFANGSKSYPKERLEVFCGGRVICLDNFRRLQGYGFRTRISQRAWLQDKGHDNELAAFVDAVRDGTESPIPAESSFHVSAAVFAAIASIPDRQPVAVV